MKLNELQASKGSVKNRTRVGRGIGSGKGKTSGAGQKGQKARSGVAIKGFEGGQMPIYKRLPKRGFHNPFSKNYAEISLGRLQKALDTKKLDGKKDITAEALREAGVINRELDGVRLIGGGELKSKVSLKITGGSKPAIAAVEKAGGSVEVGVYPLDPNAGKSEAKKADEKPKAKKTTSKKTKDSK